MSTKASSKRQLNDVTECPSCFNPLTDPRELPCIHTYCLNCIREWFKDGEAGDKVPCPVCRKDFAIPVGGLDNLPKNIFVMKVMSIKILSTSEKEELKCELCDSDESASADKKATRYCLDCQQKLCAACCSLHSKFKQFALHKTIDLREKIAEDDLCVRCPPSYCEKHRDKCVEIYCLDCKAATCMMCFFELHNSHKCSDINTVSDEFLTEMSRDIGSLSEHLNRCERQLENLEISKVQFNAKIDETEMKVHDRAQQLHDLIDRDKCALLNELIEIRQERVKEMETLREEIEQHAMVVGGLKIYLEQVKVKGAASDIVREANGLKTRSDELVNVEAKIFKKSANTVGVIEITFDKFDTMLETGSNAVGKICNQTIRKNMNIQPKAPSLVHVIPPSNLSAGVRSVALRGSQLFVGREWIARVDVYDMATFSLQRQLSIAGLASLVTGLATCDVNNCLYVSDLRKKSIHKVDLSTYDAVLTWSVAASPYGLSVNAMRNVLVACFDSRKIQEYTTVGSLVREVCLRDGSGPLHAIQLPSGQLVVSHKGSLHRVSIVGLDGRVIRSYEYKRGSQTGTFSNPWQIALFSEQGYVLVTDSGNDRIMVLNSTLSEDRQLPLPVDGGVTNAVCLCLDESRGRLCLGEISSKGRVLVYENVSNVDALFKK